jgi:hypothetical protein
MQSLQPVLEGTSHSTPPVPLKRGGFLFYGDADIGSDGDLQDMNGLIWTMVERGHNSATWRYSDSLPCCPERLRNKRDVYDYYYPHRNQTMGFLVSSMQPGCW